MVYILEDIIVTCSDPGLASILSLLKTFLNIIQIIGPIIALISLVIILIKLISNPENQKLKSAFKNWLIALIMLFLVPIIVDASMQLLDDSFSVASCWNYAEQVSLGKN